MKSDLMCLCAKYSGINIYRVAEKFASFVILESSVNLFLNMVKSVDLSHSIGLRNLDEA